MLQITEHQMAEANQSQLSELSSTPAYLSGGKSASAVLSLVSSHFEYQTISGCSCFLLVLNEPAMSNDESVVDIWPWALAAPAHLPFSFPPLTCLSPSYLVHKYLLRNVY